MKTLGWQRAWSVFATTTFYLAFTLSLSAQVETKTSTVTGKATVVTKVDRGEVVTVSGSDLIVRMPDGSIRHIEHVPESARVTVDGKQLGIHDLKPGMKLERTITTTTTPKTITTVQSVTGKVWLINPPLSIILTLANGKNQQFKIPDGQKFNVEGQMVDAWGVRKGMTITATKVVEVSDVETAQRKTVTGEAAPVVATAPPQAPPPTPPPADVPVLVAEGNEEPAPADAATPAKAADATPASPTGADAPPVSPEGANPASRMWLIGLGVLMLLAAIVWYVNRSKRSSS
jgi:hypothetical protein